MKILTGKKTLSGYEPQKKRSRFRVWCGSVAYKLLRYFLWIKHNKDFAKKSKLTQDEIKREFPYVAFSHSSPLYRNLSKEDTELQNGKVHNLCIAQKKVDCVILNPGEIFSYWKLIGNPTKFRGYKNGMMLVNGRPASKIGGGLCALSNLVFWMSLHTNLTVIERWHHSFDVFPDSNRTQPFGSGATCVYNYRDLMIKNETKNPFAILIWIENNRLCGQWRCTEKTKDSYEVYEKEQQITCEFGSVYVRHNKIFRKHFYDNQLVEDNQVVENHCRMMYEPLLSDGQNEKK